MSERYNDDRDESDDDHADGDRGTDESDHWLSSLLSALETIERGTMSKSGRRGGHRPGFEYDLSIRSIDDLASEGAPFGRRWVDGEKRERTAGRPSARRVRSSGPSSDHHVAIRQSEDELLVTADLAGVDPDDVTVGFDDSELVIAVGGRELDRVDVPWRETTSQATIKNAVLTVRVRPERSDAEGTDETGVDRE